MLQWTVTKNKEGQERNSHAFVAVGHKLYSFGGKHNYNDQIDVHVFNTVSLSWVNLPPVTIGKVERPNEVSSTHWGHTAVLVEDIIYIWGGVPYGNVLYAFDVNLCSWFKPEVSGTVPEARCCHSACVLGRVMYIFGGFSWLTKYSSNDIYKLDTTALVWSLINPRGTPAPPSECHSATIIGTKMFVMGGQESHYKSHYDIRVFDTGTNCWLSMPSARLPSEGYMCHSAFVYNGELYLFGHTEINDFWKFNPETFSWKKVEPKGKGPCRMFRMCCCMVEDRIIFFKDDLHILDFSPSLKTLCKIAVIQYALEQSELPHDIRWELAAMTTNGNR